AFAFPSLFKAISGCFPLRRQPVLFSLTMPPAALASAGGMPWFFGLCGEYAGFGIGFAALGVVSGLAALTLPLLRPRAAHTPLHP
ncbi:MAG: MFS transporter, partial [Desulfovibrionaceae bacterium]|nr:MFS transporter [Desulfovibrionaceae bacterium]